MAGQTLYEFLAVSPDCTVYELKSAWRKKAKTLHPDVNGGDAAKTALFIQVKAIYEKALKHKEAKSKPQKSFEEMNRDLNRQMDELLRQQGMQGPPNPFSSIFGRGFGR